MKICIVKLGADGDVLRTIPLAKALKDLDSGAEITWITKGDVADLLSNLTYVDRVVDLSESSKILEEDFDKMYNFDFDKEALELAGKIKAGKKYGFKEDSGYPAAYNFGAEYYLNTMFDDELKKTNKKTYQEMMFELAEIHSKRERCDLVLSEEAKSYADDFIENNTIGDSKIIGIHMGASSRWPSKMWHIDRVKEFVVLAKKKGYEVLLFGGPNEAGKHEELIESLREEGIESILRNDPKNTKQEFAALVDLCCIFVCADSFSSHVSLGLGIPTVTLFFVTNPVEIEGYNIMKKIIAPRFSEFFPEKSDQYDEELVKSISAEFVFNEVEKIIRKE